MVTTADALVPVPTANDRLKRDFPARLAVALVTATVIHLLVFALWPTMGAPVWADNGVEVVDLVPLDEIELPPAPKPLPRPMAPVASTDAPIDLTLPVVPWQRDKVELPPPPPAGEERTAGSAVPFTPYEVGPSLANAAEARRALERAYPAILREAGIEGRVALLVHIDEQGRVLEARVGTSSGVAALDQAALKAVDAFRFHPALNRDQPAAVWVRFPVTFELTRAPKLL